MNKKLVLWTGLSLILCIAIKQIWFEKTYDIAAHLQAYGSTQQRIHQKRIDFEKDWQQNPAKQPYLQTVAQAYIYRTLTDSIFPYWYGTKWDFNGTTQKPLKGKIACGYFVTTTLKHLNFYLPRFKLAQQPASIIIKTLCSESSIKTLDKLTKLKSYMDSQKEGLYIVGLDTHVGFLWKQQTKLYFVHASYSGNKQVSKELWKESKVLRKSKIFVIGNLLDNPSLIKHWILGKNIAINK